MFLRVWVDAGHCPTRRHRPTEAEPKLTHTKSNLPRPTPTYIQPTVPNTIAAIPPPISIYTVKLATTVPINMGHNWTLITEATTEPLLDRRTASPINLECSLTDLPLLPSPKTGGQCFMAPVLAPNLTGLSSPSAGLEAGVCATHLFMSSAPDAYLTMLCVSHD